MVCGEEAVPFSVFIAQCGGPGSYSSLGVWFCKLVGVFFCCCCVPPQPPAKLISEAPTVW